MNRDFQTPQWVDNILARLAPGELEEEIRGDLYELFVRDVDAYGVFTARRKYIFNALGFLAKSFFWRKSSFQTNPFTMISSYFKMARRSLMAYKGTSVINIIGLVTGISAALVVATVVKYELSFNKDHSDFDRIYRIVRVSGPDMSEFRTGVSYPVAGAIRDEVAAVEEITSVEYFGGAYVDIMDSTGGSVAMFREDFGCVLVQPSFFKIFDFRDADFKWLAGDPATALTQPFDVVLTESIAKKYFPDGDAIGKAIRFEKFFDARIAGVVSDF
ncbi:MAG TPA: ABC transporter permease, partial [Chryseosolibacter sp.]|nr:ABC transporter permease [Chryseosolibacter sp.]